VSLCCSGGREQRTRMIRAFSSFSLGNVYIYAFRRPPRRRFPEMTWTTRSGFFQRAHSYEKDAQAKIVCDVTAYSPKYVTRQPLYDQSYLHFYYIHRVVNIRPWFQGPFENGQFRTSRQAMSYSAFCPTTNEPGRPQYSDQHLQVCW
jgi:hypothetical protein